MAVFGLVHGGFHGAWCWDRLIPELSARGHDSVAMDLPLEDPDASLADYVDAVVESLDGVHEPVILVGHSMGGLVIPHVAHRRPVAQLVFICAMFDNLPGAELVDSLPKPTVRAFDSSILTEVAPGLRVVEPEAAVTHFYPDCDPADAAWAVSQLRPMGSAAGHPLTAPWPVVPSTVITTSDDRQRDLAVEVVAPRLGVEAIVLPGGHSPFLSQKEALADVLDRVASGGAGA
jgi:pimeloyl-ACP methyl ester carboxylesterase